MLKMLAVVAVTVALCAPNAADELVAGKVSKLPAIDGKADDDAWKTAKEVVVKIDQPDENPPKKTISIKAVHDGSEICFLLVWADPDKNDQHSPFIWKDPAGYEPDEEKVEDACTLAFELEGKFDSDMKAGIESKWDVWEWGAARTNPSGYALDRTHVYSRTAPTPPVKGRRLTAVSDKQIHELGVEITPLHPETALRQAGALYECRHHPARDFFANHFHQCSTQSRR